MAYAYGGWASFAARRADDYACVGAPPEKEVVPEPRWNGATLAAIARVLRGVLAPSAGPADKGLKPEDPWR